MKISKQIAYHMARQIKKRGKENCLKGWILFYPYQIDVPVSNNYCFVDDEEYKSERLSNDYIEILEVDLKESDLNSIKKISNNLFTIISNI
jgi:hypothetical protein